MTERAPLPELEEIRRILSAMIGRAVAVVPASDSRWAPGNSEAAWAVLSDDSGSDAVYVACDKQFALACGTSVAMFPAFRMQEHASEPVLPEGVRENLHEVINVLSAVFNGVGELHVKLTSLTSYGEATPPQILASAARPDWREDLFVTIDGYGGPGRLTIIPV